MAKAFDIRKHWELVCTDENGVIFSSWHDTLAEAKKEAEFTREFCPNTVVLYVSEITNKAYEI